VARIDPILAKIERAKKHIRDLDEEVRAFLGPPHPYEVSTEFDAKVSKIVHYVSSLKPIDPIIPIIAGDAVQNLRTALDYLIVQLVDAHSGNVGEKRLRKTGFPMFESPEEMTPSKIKKKIGGVSPDAEKAILILKPYKGGNNDLWGLHELNRVEKHRLLITAIWHGPTHMGYSIDIETRTKAGAIIPDVLKDFTAWGRYPNPKALEVGKKIVWTDASPKGHENYKFLFNIALSEPEVFGGKPLVETLNGMADLVGQIASDFSPLLP
jgi:hypothetical protein